MTWQSAQIILSGPCHPKLWFRLSKLCMSFDDAGSDRIARRCTFVRKCASPSQLASPPHVPGIWEPCTGAGRARHLRTPYSDPAESLAQRLDVWEKSCLRYLCGGQNCREFGHGHVESDPYAQLDVNSITRRSISGIALSCMSSSSFSSSSSSRFSASRWVKMYPPCPSNCKMRL